MKFPNSYYTPDQIEVLHTAFYLVCAQVGVKDDDDAGRGRIAKALIDLGRSGQLDIDCLKLYAVSQFHANM